MVGVACPGWRRTKTTLRPSAFRRAVALVEEVE
jgi:hypothetical protein